MPGVGESHRPNDNLADAGVNRWQNMRLSHPPLSEMLALDTAGPRRLHER